MAKRPLYSNFYHWETPLSNEIIGHDDGGVSCMLLFGGIDCEMDDDAQRYTKYQDIYKFLGGLEDCVAEFHLWRERDSRLADRYLAENENIKRGRHLAVPVRTAMAQHLTKYGWNNECAVVLYRSPQESLITKLRNKSRDASQIKNAEALFDQPSKLKRLFGANLATA